ncbi:MAG: hypothetical protein GY754_08110, partial [bacterium]|nr:hypothetical protein [bacterium]
MAGIRKTTILAIIFIILLSPWRGFALTPLSLDNTREEYKLAPYLEYLEDPQGTITIRGIESGKYDHRFTRNTGGTPNMGYVNSAYWVRFSCVFPTGEKKWLLELEYPLLDYVDLYIPGAAGTRKKIETGDMILFKKRQIKHHNFVFFLPTKAGTEQVYYVRLQSEGSIQMPFLIWSQKAFTEKVNLEQTVMGIYFGIMLVMILYNICIFIVIRNFSYFFYVLHIFFMLLAQSSFSGYTYEFLWPGSPEWANSSILLLASLGVAMAVLFSRLFLQTKKLFPTIDKFIIFSLVLITAFAGFSFLVRYSTAVQCMSVLVMMIAIACMVIGIICLAKGYRAARFYLLAWFVFFIGIIAYILKSFGILPFHFLTEHAIKIGGSLEVILLSFALADRIGIINREKEHARRETVSVQEKYRLLFEGSNDIIFSLDDDWLFISVNNSVQLQLMVGPESLIGTPFLNLIYEEPNAANKTKQFVTQQFELFSKEKNPVSFRTEFKMPLKTEAKQMQVHLEYVTLEGKNEILGKASSVDEDIFLQCFVSEKQNMIIGNSIYNVDEFTFRITRNLNKYVSLKRSHLLRVALREIIINAIEHGNLDISYEEKTEALAQKKFFALMEARQNDPRYSLRKVVIDFEINPDRVIYTVTDEGNGFIFQPFINSRMADVNKRMESHGRGIIMAKNIFD